MDHTSSFRSVSLLKNKESTRRLGALRLIASVLEVSVSMVKIQSH